MAKKTKPTKKLIVPTLPPRNPFVAAAKLRHAGSHRPSQKAERQKQQRELRDTCQQLAKKIPVDDGDFSCHELTSHARHNHTCLALVLATTVFVRGFTDFI